MRNYKKWRRNQIALFGAERLLEKEESVRSIKQKAVSVGAKYVPSSIQEIQLGTTLEIAKQSRVSFDPDNTLGEEPAEEGHEDQSPDDEVKKDGKIGVAEALVDFDITLFSSLLCCF